MQAHKCVFGHVVFCSWSPLAIRQLCHLGRQSAHSNQCNTQEEKAIARKFAKLRGQFSESLPSMPNAHRTPKFEQDATKERFLGDDCHGAQPEPSIYSSGPSNIAGFRPVKRSLCHGMLFTCPMPCVLLIVNFVRLSPIIVPCISASFAPPHPPLYPDPLSPLCPDPLSPLCPDPLYVLIPYFVFITSTSPPLHLLHTPPPCLHLTQPDPEDVLRQGVLEKRVVSLSCVWVNPKP
jgi:hypothetical protein